MAINPAPRQHPIAPKDGIISSIWVKWFQLISDTLAKGKKQSFTVLTLPSAALYGAGAVVFVSDESGGATLAFSDGTDWRRVTDRNVVS